MNDITKVVETLNANESITSLELLEEINIFREEESKSNPLNERKLLRHDTLRSIIKDEFEEEILSQDILEKSISSNGGRPTSVYILSLGQAKQVLVRESKFVRKAVICYIDKLEKSLSNKFSIPQTYSEALLLASNQAKQIEEQQKLIEVQTPKVDFFDAVADSKSAVPMISVAKVLAVKGLGRNNLFEFLRNKNILMRNNQPYQKYVDAGYFRIIEQRYQKNGEECINIKTLVYQKGIDFIRKAILSNTSNIGKNYNN